MWHLAHIATAYQLWFSDGLPTDVARGGNTNSSRLIVDQQGFLDLTEHVSSEVFALNANDEILHIRARNATDVSCPSLDGSSLPYDLDLRLGDDGTFELGLSDKSDLIKACYTVSEEVSGHLKPLPTILDSDVAIIGDMIEAGIMPYQNIPDSPGKTTEEIKAVGRRFFPFTPHSFQLSMSIYDWTTASFTRLVLFKIFQYTSVPPSPYPLDDKSLATEIWESNFSTYTPQNVDYMRSFLMEPAHSLDEVKAQLSHVRDRLYQFAEAHNRLLSAAFESLPRTSVLSKPQLFSGQVDIYQLGLEHFGIEFLECPLNDGPVGEELVTSFAGALSSYISVGKTITTKMVWSFTDSMEDALHYSNGILIVANPGDNWVWETASYITDLSDDPAKIEYTFAPGSRFEVESIDETSAMDTKVTVITVKPIRKDKDGHGYDGFGIVNDAKARGMVDPVRAAKEWQPFSRIPHSEGKNGGRQCQCYR